MKYRSTAKWQNRAGSENLLYFAQLLEELLFDFSLDTYKPSAMNSSLLCKEALDTHYEIEEGNIKRPNFQHVLNELCTNLEKDKVAEALLQIDLQSVTPTLKNPKADFHAKRVVVELLARQLDLNKYKELNSKMLISALEDNSTSRSAIRSLTRSYVTCLVNLGYSTKFIEEKTLQYFHYANNPIVGNSDIREFLSFFPSTPKEYLVVYRGSEKLRNLKESFEKINIKLCDNAQGVGFDLTDRNFDLAAGQVYVVVSKIQAVDIIGAQVQASNQIELISTLYSLFHHKERLESLEKGLVVEIGSGEVSGTKNVTNTMHKCSDLIPGRASAKLNKLITEFSLHKKSFNKFTRSAELHSLALSSDSIENQMINLWIALESIIPTKPEEREISNIEHIINSITPFLSLGYIDRLMAKFTKDALNWNSGLVKRTLKPIKGSGLAAKMAALMALQQHQGAATTFRSEFRDFHLLADRFDYFSHVFSSPKAAHDVLQTHNERVAWQIRRIYRARNLIVHSGKTPSYTEILIENTHDYLDIIMGVLMKLAVRPKQISSIEQGFMYVDLSYQSLMKWLSTKGSSFDENSIDYVLGKRVI